MTQAGTMHPYSRLTATDKVFFVPCATSSTATATIGFSGVQLHYVRVLERNRVSHSRWPPQAPRLVLTLANDLTAFQLVIRPPLSSCTRSLRRIVITDDSRQSRCRRTRSESGS